MSQFPDSSQSQEHVIVRGEIKLAEAPPERALLVGIDRPNSEWDMDESLDELSRLAHTAGAEEAARTTQKLQKPNPATFIGSGKVDEIAALCEQLDIDVVIFDDELTPTQQSNLERSVRRDIKIIDRTALILDIFAMHAKTKEGRLQVRLAQNQYLYPRLRGMWAHLASNRMGGGVGSRFGEGESQLEVDRRMVRKRITKIRKELESLSKVRAQQREERYKSGIFKLALVGYTNAGKSSILNAICDADVYSDDLLFATLDSTTRRLELPEGREVTLTDTVGFIQKLPTTLVEAFKSTLDEIRGADLLLHIVDASSESKYTQMKSVDEVLQQIDSASKGRIVVFNKCDLLDDSELLALKHRNPDAIFLSAKEKLGLDTLVQYISRAATSKDVPMDLLVPFDRGEMVSLAHRRCRIMNEEFSESGTRLSLRVPESMVGMFSQFQI